MTSPEPNYDVSIDFLRRWTGDWWVLTSISLDKKRVVTKTFSREDEAGARAWLAQEGAERNIYFHVNPTTEPLDRKANREQISKLAWLHVDIDPRAGEDLDEERERCLKLLCDPDELDKRKIPPPTAVIFSGGGYQGFWRLQEPFDINGDLALAEEAKLWNRQLELLFGADDCHNVDRIMRLPGTINRPDAKKRKKGRTEQLADLVRFEESCVYDLAKFTKAPQTQETSGSSSLGGRGQLVNVSGDIPKLDSVDDLPEGVPDYVKVLIVQGQDPENPTKYPSRSEALFAVCCGLVRAGVDDDTIYSVITDPDFGIAESVLEKGSRSRSYAEKQINSARENAVDPVLMQMNAKHAVIGNFGGKCRVIEEIYDPVLKRHRLTRSSFEDIRNRYMNEYVQVGEEDGKPKMKPAGHWWLANRNRRQYDTVIFAPGRDVPGAYNLWQGFAYDAMPGAGHEPFLEHLRSNVCQGNEEHYNYLVGWMARAVQSPDSPGYTAVVMRGRQGTGKSFVPKHFGALFGRHYMQVTDPKHLVGSFNAHLRDCVILFGDEAFYAGDQKHSSILKMLVTEEQITVEAKGVDAEAAANCVHLLMASNDAWVVPAGMEERRFFVLDVGDGKIQDGSYFGAIAEALEQGGYANLLWFLMNYDLSQFDVRTVPQTKALQSQKLLSMTPDQQWWFEKLQSGQLLDHHSGWKGEVSKPELQADYIEWTKSWNVARRGNATKLGHFLASALPEDWPETEQRRDQIVIEVGGREKSIKRPYWYKLPPLSECRDYWDAHFGGPYDWPDENAIAEMEESDDVPF